MNTTIARSQTHATFGRYTVEQGKWHGGPRSRFSATYTDIVAGA